MIFDKHIRRFIPVTTLWLVGCCLFTIVLPGCEDEVDPVSTYETGTMTDIDGNVYTTVKIGNQWWMSQDLKVKHYRNGMEVPSGQDPAAWQQDQPAWCLYDNNADAPGLLYNWQAVYDTSVLAPDGWHIPTDQEWKTLEIFLGMSSSQADALTWRGANEADKLRIASPLGWTRYGTVWSTNESGFTARAGSCRLSDGTWGDPGLFATGFWWTSSSYGDEDGWYRYMDYKNSNIFRSHVARNYGMSIRCVKD